MDGREVTPFEGHADGSGGPLSRVPQGPGPLSWSDGADEDGEGGTDLKRLASVFRRYKWMILVIAVLGLAAGVVAAELLPASYAAQATLWIQADNSRASSEQGPIQSQELLGQSVAWVQLLRSFSVLDYVVREQHMFLQTAAGQDRGAFKDFTLEDRFRPGSYVATVTQRGDSVSLATSTGGLVERKPVGDTLGLPVGFAWVPAARDLTPGRVFRFQVSVPRDVSVNLNKKLQAQIDDKSGSFMKVSLDGSNPERVAATVNAITQRYVDVAADLKRKKLDELTAILAEQLRASEAALKTAESQLESFRVNTITLPSEQTGAVAPGLQQTENPVMTRYFDLRVEAEQVKRDREAIQQALSGQKSHLVDALEAIGSVEHAPDLSTALAELVTQQAKLRDLKQRYTDADPRVIQLQQAVDTLQGQTVPTLAGHLAAQLKTREDQIGRYVASASTDLRQIPPRAIEEGRLQRQKTLAEDLYTTLQKRYQEARLAAASSIPDVQILDRAAVPSRPLSNRKPEILLLALFGSLGLGLMGAILRDRLDPRFRYPEQASALGLDILGGLPHVRTVRGQTDGESTRQLVEAIRTLRLNLLQAHGSAGPMMVTITSPGSGDGKSMITTNLGLSCSQLGRRTLLIDGDVRRGRLHRLLKTTQTPGLTDYIEGRVELADVIRPTEFPSLDVIPTGSRFAHAPELLASPRLRELLLRLRPRYDVILVDSPPLGAGADPLVLGSATGNVMLVLRTGSTDRALLQAKMEGMHRLPFRVLGATLNDVPPSESSYRYYSYLPGYGIDADHSGQLVGAGSGQSSSDKSSEA